MNSSNSKSSWQQRKIGSVHPSIRHQKARKKRREIRGKICQDGLAPSAKSREENAHIFQLDQKTRRGDECNQIGGSSIIEASEKRDDYNDGMVCE